MDQTGYSINTHSSVNRWVSALAIPCVLIMRFLDLTLVLSFTILAKSQALHPAYPAVKLDTATITGISNGSLNKFLGIPFAKAPYVFFIIYHYLLQSVTDSMI